MDPLILVQLAEKDVEACGSLLSSHTSEEEPLTMSWLLVKAKTLAMNEKYAKAKETFVEGLSIDPDNEVMLKGLRAVQDILMSYENSSKRQKTLTGVTTQDLDCIIWGEHEPA